MSLADLIVHCGIIAGCQLFNKQQLVEQMLLQLAVHGHIAVAELPSLSAGIRQRESLGTTGIGGGVAVPHTRHRSIQRLICGVFLFRPQVQFDSIDGELADIVVLFLSPTPTHLEQRINDDSVDLLHQLGRKEVCERIRQSVDGEEIMLVLCSPANAVF